MFNIVYDVFVFYLPTIRISLAAVHGEVAGAPEVDDLLVLLAGLVLP